jgi:KTSC domain
MESDVIKARLNVLQDWVHELAVKVPMGSVLREFLLESEAYLNRAKTIFEPVERKEPHVKSSTIKSYGYNAVAKVLEVEFQNESIYRYYAVSQSNVDLLDTAESLGLTFTRVIRSNKSFPYEKIKDAKPKVSQTQYEGML